MSHYLTLVLGVLTALALLRAGVTLLGANPEHQLVALLYQFTEPFVAPFENIFPPIGIPIDLAALVAASALLLVAAFIRAAGRRAAELPA